MSELDVRQTEHGRTFGLDDVDVVCRRPCVSQREHAKCCIAAQPI